MKTIFNSLDECLKESGYRFVPANKNNKKGDGKMSRAKKPKLGIKDSIQWININLGQLSKFVQNGSFRMTGENLEVHLTNEVIVLNVGDYLVRHASGSLIGCSAEWYDDHFECMDVNGMSFGKAIEALKACKWVARKGWNGNGIFLELQVPDKHSKMSQPYIYIDTTGLKTENPDAPKGRVPWLASQTDMLAEDWYVVDKVEKNCLNCLGGTLDSPCCSCDSHSNWKGYK